MYLNHPEDEDEDCLTVEPIPDGFRVTYEFNRTPTTPATQIHEFVGDAQSVLEYFADIFCLLSMDQKPFTEVEFLIPFYPNISLTPNNFSGVVCKTLLRVIGTYLEHYTE